jgi:hypothetical protein
VKRIAVLACTVALAGALGGCGVKAGDGDLVNGWPMLGAPKVPEPAVGTCWSTSATEVDKLTQTSMIQTTCDLQHVFETVKIGHFTGSVASSSTAPNASDMTDAWTDCAQAATDYLGGEWQSGRVYVTVIAPTSRQWGADARFYRCDVGALRTELGLFDPRNGSMKGTLASGGELRLGCGNQVNTTDNSWDDITAAKCTDPHDTEYVGSVTSASSDYPSGSKALETAFDEACKTKMLSYIGMSRSNLSSQKALYYGYWMIAGKDGWAQGNHSARCYAMIYKKKINRSLKGAGDTQI